MDVVFVVLVKEEVADVERGRSGTETEKRSFPRGESGDKH